MFLEVEKGHKANDKSTYIKKNYPGTNQEGNIQMKVVWSVNFKYIIEVKELNNNGTKLSTAGTNTLDLRYVKNYKEF